MITLNTIAQANSPAFGNISNKNKHVVTITDIVENYGYPIVDSDEFIKDEEKEIVEQRRLLKKELKRPDSSTWKYKMYMKHNMSEYLEEAADNKNIEKLMKAVDEKSIELYPKTNGIRQALVSINQITPDKINPKMSKFKKILVRLIA